MHLSWFFQLKPIVRWVFRGAKKLDSIHSLSIPTIITKGVVYCITSHEPRCSAKSSRIEPCMLGAFKPLRRLPQYWCYYCDKTCCKNPLLSFYHHVVNTALPQFLPWFYHQFSATSINPIKQSHYVVYLETTDLLATKKPIPSFL